MVFSIIDFNVPLKRYFNTGIPENMKYRLNYFKKQYKDIAHSDFGDRHYRFSPNIGS